MKRNLLEHSDSSFQISFFKQNKTNLKFEFKNYLFDLTLEKNISTNKLSTKVKVIFGQNWNNSMKQVALVNHHLSPLLTNQQLTVVKNNFSLTKVLNNTKHFWEIASYKFCIFD